MEDYMDAALQLNVRLELLAKNADEVTRKILKTMQKDLIHSMGLDPIQSKKHMLEVQRGMRSILADRMPELKANLEKHSEVAAKAATKLEQSQMINLGASAAKDFKGFYSSRDIVKRSAQRAMPGLSAGTHYTVGQMLTDMGNGTNRNILTIANQALAEGWSVPRASRAIRDTTDLTYRQSKAAARTSIQSAANQAREDVANEFDELIGKEIWMSTLDSRTCEYCAGLDGQCKDQGQLPKPIAHPNCRCVIIYVPAGMTCEEMKELIDRPSRDPETGKSLPAKKYKDYESWMKEQPAWFQDEVLGKARAEALRAGTITFKGMYTKNGSRKTLEALGVVKPKPKVKVPVVPKTTAAVPVFPVAEANGYYNQVPSYLQAPHLEKLLAADGDYKVEIMDPSEGAFYRRSVKGINMSGRKLDMTTRNSVTFLHEFGHRADHKYGDAFSATWDNVPSNYGRYVSGTRTWGLALGDDAKALKKADRDGWKKMGGTGRYKTRGMYEKHREFAEQTMDEALSNFTEKHNSVLEYLRETADKELKGPYANMLNITKKQDIQRRRQEGTSKIFNTKKANDLKEREQLLALLNAQRSGSERFILDEWLNAFKGHYTNDMDRFGVYLADSIEAATSGKHGFGHGAAYYNNTHSRGTETFANFNSLWNDPDARVFFKKYLPKQAKLWETFLDEVKT